MGTPLAWKEEKSTGTVLFSNLCPQRKRHFVSRAAPKRTGRGPLRNLHDQDGSLLDLPAFGGLGPLASDRQRFSRGRPFGKEDAFTWSEYRYPFARG